MKPTYVPSAYAHRVHYDAKKGRHVSHDCGHGEMHYQPDSGVWLCGNCMRLLADHSELFDGDGALEPVHDFGQIP